jgi:hypothetical protein
MQMNLSDAIVTITESFLPQFTPDQVLCFTIDSRIQHYDDKNKHIHYTKGLYIVIHRPSNYTRVIIAEEKKNLPVFTFNPDADFKYKSDHDSCWKGDGISSPLFKAASEMVSEIQKLGAPHLSLNQYSWFNHIPQIKIVPGRIDIERNSMGMVVKTQLILY